MLPPIISIARASRFPDCLVCDYESDGTHNFEFVDDKRIFTGVVNHYSLRDKIP